MTYEIITLGCKLNSCESAAIAKDFSENGYERAADGEKADIYIINSCAVTGVAVSKTRHALSKCKRENPDCVTVLCGCFPQSYPEEAGLNSCADIITGNSQKGSLSALVGNYLENRVKAVKISPLSREFDVSAAIPDEDRTRAFIKVEDGCDRFCAYCIIPTARGRVRSLPPEKITEQSSLCVSHGHKEIVLTGINLSCYGQELGLTLGDAAAAAAKSGVERIRLSSLEPEMLTDEEISKLKSIPQLCPHFHLSLQSGSDSVLKRMNRRYDTALYKQVTDKLRSAFRGCSITTDIIVGFPGETDEEFFETLDFAQEIGFAKIHVFPYSIREGTVAAEMPQVPPDIKNERVRILTAVSAELEMEFFGTQRGSIHTVLIEKPRSAEYSIGFTESYIPVRIFGKELPRHSLVKVMISGYREGYCEGKLI